MYNQNFELYNEILREHQAELQKELLKDAWLRDPAQISGPRQRLIISLVLAAVVVVGILAIFASNAHVLL